MSRLTLPDLDETAPKRLRARLGGFREAVEFLRERMKTRHNRHVSIADLLSDRWETARFYGFGEGASCYNNVLILGEVKVGRHSWIGPNVVLDGSGGLEIGDHCSISAGVQIYTHHTVNRSTSRGVAPVEKSPTRIGHGVYIGPNSVVQMGCTIGNGAVIGAMSFVNRDIPENARCFGVPVRLATGAGTAAPGLEEGRGDE